MISDDAKQEQSPEVCVLFCLVWLLFVIVFLFIQVVRKGIVLVFIIAERQ